MDLDVKDSETSPIFKKWLSLAKRFNKKKISYAKVQTV